MIAGEGVRPRVLDLFCGAGGCSVGYHRAGLDVDGVDIEPHDDYPFELLVADAMDVLTDTAYLDRYDVVHASPPCPRYSSMTTASSRPNHPDLVPTVLDALRSWGGTWVMENVPGAPMPHAVIVCGAAMGLPRIRRHRLFDSSEPLFTPGCCCGPGQPVGVYGGKRGWGRDTERRPDGTRRGRHAHTHAEASEVMGIDWMTDPGDLSDAIPPAYTEYIGSQLLNHLTHQDAAA